MIIKQTLSDYEAEQAILGAIIYSPKMYSKVEDFLPIDSFNDPPNRKIYWAICTILKNQVGSEYQIDENIIGSFLSDQGYLQFVGGYQYLVHLVDCAPVSSHIMKYAEIVYNHYRRRETIELANKLSKMASDTKTDINSILSEHGDSVADILLKSGIGNNFKHIKDILADNVKDIENLSSGKCDHVVGVKTGFVHIDKLTGGLAPGDLVIVAARPGMGKTALALNIASYAARMDFNEGAIGVLSREMQNSKLGRRMIASDAMVNTHSLKTGRNIDQNAWDNICRSVDRLSGCQIYFNDKTKHIDDIIAEFKMLNDKVRGGLKLAIVDYLQIVRERLLGNREQEISSISGKLKDLAKELNIPVLALAQLNRTLEQRTDKRPLLSDIRESGAIEQDADIIMFIYRVDQYNENSKKPGIAEIIVAKHRDGPTGIVELIWDGQHTSFRNMPSEYVQHSNNQQGF